MSTKSILGYGIAGVGVVILALGTIPGLRAPLKILVEPKNDIYFMGAGLLLAVIGVIISSKASSGQKLKEVPIYHGDQVVGFRRLGKK